MTDPYAAWIAVTVRGNLRGRCAAWTRQMQRVFPELRRVGGIVAPADRPPYAGGHLVQHHWWLLTPVGQVVDPTARQFGWPLVYIAFGDEAALMRACTAWDEFVRLLHTAVPSPEPTPYSVRGAPASRRG